MNVFVPWHSSDICLLLQQQLLIAVSREIPPIPSLLVVVGPVWVEWQSPTADGDSSFRHRRATTTFPINRRPVAGYKHRPLRLAHLNAPLQAGKVGTKVKPGPIYNYLFKPKQLNRWESRALRMYESKLVRLAGWYSAEPNSYSSLGFPST